MGYEMRHACTGLRRGVGLGPGLGCRLAVRHTSSRQPQPKHKPNPKPKPNTSSRQPVQKARVASRPTWWCVPWRFGLGSGIASVVRVAAGVEVGVEDEGRSRVGAGGAAPYQAVVALARPIEGPRGGDVIDARSDSEVERRPAGLG